MFRSRFTVPLIAAGALLATGLTTLPAHAEDPLNIRDGIHRISGSDRYATAVALSKQGFAPEGTEFVYLATGENFPDALSAATAAADAKAPLLLTRRDGLPASVKAEIQRLKPTTVIVVGGPGAISDNVLKEIPQKTVRVFGADRYETSTKLAEQSFFTTRSGEPQQRDNLFLATGWSFPDALGAAGAAGNKKAPVVLIDGQGSGLSTEKIAALKRWGTKNITLVGGSGAIGTDIEEQLKSEQFGVMRIGGTDRYETAAMINKQYFRHTNYQFLATGENFPDALAAGASAGQYKMPLFLTRQACMPGSVMKINAADKLIWRVVMGGTGAVSDAAAHDAPCGDTGSDLPATPSNTPTSPTTNQPGADGNPILPGTSKP